MVATEAGLEPCPRCNGMGEESCCLGSPSLVEKQVEEIMEANEE